MLRIETSAAASSPSSFLRPDTRLPFDYKKGPPHDRAETACTHRYDGQPYRSLDTHSQVGLGAHVFLTASAAGQFGRSLRERESYRYQTISPAN